MTKGVDEKIFEGVLWLLDHVKRMKNKKIARRVYIVKCAGSHSVDWYNEGLLNEEVWMSGKQGEWYMIGINGQGLWREMYGVLPGGMNPWAIIF